MVGCTQDGTGVYIPGGIPGWYIGGIPGYIHQGIPTQGGYTPYVHPWDTHPGKLHTLCTSLGIPTRKATHPMYTPGYTPSGDYTPYVHPWVYTMERGTTRRVLLPVSLGRRPITRRVLSPLNVVNLAITRRVLSPFQRWDIPGCELFPDVRKLRKVKK